jgi:inosine-uridine nucleoside N-ribohydrolase
MAPKKRSVVLDIDPGMGFPWADIDDNLALLFALAQEGVSVDLISIVCGNVAAVDGVRSISRTLSLARRTIPVAIGSRSPLVRPYQSGRAILGKRGADQGVHLSYRGEFEKNEKTPDVPWAFPLQVQLLENSREKTTFVCVGPLTNMAYLLQQRPDLGERIDSIVIMGGALEMEGNISPFAEFNTWVDPEAARIVFDSRIKKVLAPLDVTTTVALTMDEIRAVADSQNDLARYLVSATEGWVEALKALSGSFSFNPHDPIAFSYLVKPELFETKQMQIIVEERTGKMTGIECRDGTTCACLRVDGAGFKKLFLDSLRRIVQAAE